jgi:hypothetical protein
MNRYKAGAIAFCAALMFLPFPAIGNAGEGNKKTIETFSRPVEIPGVGTQVLPAGTYVFRLLGSSSNRNIVQIVSEREDHVYATMLAIPNCRLQLSGKTIVTFGERVVGQLETIRAWFYPGFDCGQEFVYPKTRAVDLAKLANRHVLAMPGELANLIGTPVISLDELPVLVLQTAPVEAVSPTGVVIPMNEVIELPLFARSATPEFPDLAVTKSLPRTASLLPLLGLLGLLLLAVGFALSLIWKRA